MATSESATMSRLQTGGNITDGGEKVAEKKREAKNYRGFVAGVFSGVSKLTGMTIYNLMFPCLRI